jgi:hypothetical protein
LYRETARDERLKDSILVFVQSVIPFPYSASYDRKATVEDVSCDARSARMNGALEEFFALRAVKNAKKSCRSM